MEVKNRIAQLTKELNNHNHNYYVLNQSEISDYEFDMLLKELQKLEEENPSFASPKFTNKKSRGRHY